MTRILLVETATPKRIFQKAEQILSADVYPEPEITVLCRESSRKIFWRLPGVEVYSPAARERHRTLKELNQKKFDVVFAFWTGERQYRRMKLLALRLRPKEVRIVGGDGNEFHLTWKALCRHAVFRWRHPLPTDHWDFVPPQAASEEREPEPKDAAGQVYEADEVYQGERVLVLQSADPLYVLQALKRLREKPPFRNPRYTLFCRNRPEVVGSFREHPMLYEVLTHSETRDSWKNLRQLRRQGFDAIVLFMTGDPSYRKIKLFAFLLGVPVRHMLIFNEAGDCFFFNFGQWFALVSHRIQEPPRLGAGPQQLLSLTIKLALLPFRFLWLLLVWLRLRLAGLRSSRKNHDYAQRLPLFPGS
jgi:hypothetical protein